MLFYGIVIICIFKNEKLEPIIYSDCNDLHNPAYNDHNTGQWIADGVGEQNTLHLTFRKKKVPPIDVTLTIRDERFMLMENVILLHSSQNASEASLDWI